MPFALVSEIAAPDVVENELGILPVSLLGSLPDSDAASDDNAKEAGVAVDAVSSKLLASGVISEAASWLSTRKDIGISSAWVASALAAEE